MEIQKCNCCIEQKKLVLRPDFGTKKNVALVALCLFHDPVTVYFWNDNENKYELQGNLKYKNNLILTEGDQPYKLIETDQNSSPPSIMELQQEDQMQTGSTFRDDAGDSRPDTDHVDLEHDDFY